MKSIACAGLSLYEYILLRFGTTAEREGVLGYFTIQN
jgi:hypothetical protein